MDSMGQGSNPMDDSQSPRIKGFNKTGDFLKSKPTYIDGTEGFPGVNPVFPPKGDPLNRKNALTEMNSSGIENFPQMPIESGISGDSTGQNRKSSKMRKRKAKVNQSADHTNIGSPGRKLKIMEEMKTREIQGTH